MNKRKIILFALLLISSQFCVGQAFEDRLAEIKILFDSLADATIPGLNETVNFDVSEAPIQEFLGLLAQSHKLNLSVTSSVNVLVSNRFADATVKDVLIFLCKVNKLDVEPLNNIIFLKPFIQTSPRPKPYIEKTLDLNYNSEKDLLDVDLQNDSLKVFARQITTLTGKNVVISNSLRDIRVSAFIKNIPFMSALAMVAETNNLALRSSEDAVFFDGQVERETSSPLKGRMRGESRTANGEKGFIETRIFKVGDVQYLDVAAQQASIVDIIHDVSQKLNLNYFFFSLPDQTVTVNLKRMSFPEVLNQMLTPTQHTFKDVNGVYLIGNRSMEGLRSSEVVKLKFRSVEDIDKIIPEGTKKEVQVSIFKELNAVILSGSAPQIAEIKNFLAAIDEPVPNILIEVMVIDVKKGYNIETGLRAILTDSAQAPQTKGTVFPGLDVTLGTNVLTKLFDGANLVNLGQVTPRFYVSLKALENNNNINIRSTPKLSTLNGHEAMLSIGQSAYFIQRTQIVTPGVTPITTVTEQFKEIEANLTITINPVVSGNEHVTLKINAEFSNFVPATVQGAPPGNATRQFNSLIRVKNGEMIVLGGLEEVTRSQTSSGVPLLSRIPVLKWFFSSRGKEKNDDRLMVFIKPVIVF